MPGERDLPWIYSSLVTETMAKKRFNVRQGVHVLPQKEVARTSEIDYRKPVLLLQGYAFAVAGPGAVNSNTVQVSTGRGTVKFLDVYPFFSSPQVFDEDVPVTISAGGQVLLQDINLGFYSFDTQSGKDRRHRVRIELNDAQTITSVLDNTNGTTIQGLAPHLYYSTPEYEFFLKNVFSLKWDLGLKRRTYRLEIPDGDTNADAFIERVLPRNNGEIIGVSITTSSEVDDARQILIDLSIDGIKIIENTFGLHWHRLNGRDNNLLPVGIRPGATMNFRGFGNTLVASGPVVFYVTFYFGRMGNQ